MKCGTERNGNIRILVDTNVLFSALVFPRSKPARALLYIADNHEIILCDRNISELRDILGRKAPKYLPDAEVLLAEMSYELIPAVDYAEKLIRDAKDQPILNAAIVSDVDVILTGDKDFLKTVHNQLSAIFNHAARFYGLNLNPARQAGNMRAEERKEMLFWTREEYARFSEAMMDKPLSFYAFEVLYWCGVREGELLALTPADFDFEKRTLTINKSYQRLNKQDVITTPKTPKSNRVIQLPQFLCDELQDYLKQLYGVEPDSRMFPISKSYLHREMDRGCKQTGVKRIRIHDLRHSHISLLIDMGFTALAIAERVGHESIDITYRYAHLFPTRQVEMADKLDSLKNKKGV